VSRCSKCEAKLLDHFVGKREKTGRNGKAKHPRDLGVDNQLEFSRLLNRHICWLSAFEDTTRIYPDLAIRILDIGSIADQATSFGVRTRGIYGGDRVARCQMDELHSPPREKATTEKSVSALTYKIREGRVDFLASGRIEYIKLNS